MTKSEATAEVFLTALKALSHKERNAVIARIARDKAFREDLLDLALIDKRRREHSRPLRSGNAKTAAHFSNRPTKNGAPSTFS